ncbi:MULTISPECIES: hypothetical protein [Pseudomonas]|jgi:hypothetical protein|uniref:hypothetical protein n=1 Tax=Pseudomonas TaxID=286 RepID=UPI002093CDAD|nr:MULTISPECIES: hypothetical protein [Pseudomonas]USS53272.1 hypothetical protein NG836_15735 [Pseudomonas kermanshahensis]UVL69125.1 hypothetical protein LOY53_11810 [Pseudomonas sp. B21-031]
MVESNNSASKKKHAYKAPVVNGWRSGTGKALFKEEIRKGGYSYGSFETKSDCYVERSNDGTILFVQARQNGLLGVGFLGATFELKQGQQGLTVDVAHMSIDGDGAKSGDASKCYVSWDKGSGLLTVTFEFKFEFNGVANSASKGLIEVNVEEALMKWS